MSSVEEFTLYAADGYALKASVFRPVGTPVGSLLMAGATGVPQRFYQRFANYAAGRGFSVITLDYRGVGKSRPASLRGFDMAYLDWAYLDLAAAVSHLTQEGLPLFWVGHSFGGHALGLQSEHALIKGAYCFGTGAGWAGWMPGLEAIKVRFMWNVVLPLMVKAKGYLAWSMLGMGEDLPVGVYRDWKRWCRYPHYFFDDPDMQHVKHRFSQLSTPCVFANAVDDRWALPRSRDAFIKHYCNAQVEKLDLDPCVSGGEIGHMGYFRPTAIHSWSVALDWFNNLLENEPASKAKGSTAY